MMLSTKHYAKGEPLGRGRRIGQAMECVTKYHSGVDGLMYESVMQNTILLPFQRNGLYGFCNQEGRVVINEKYSYAVSMVERIALAIPPHADTVIFVDDTGSEFQTLQGFSTACYGFCHGLLPGKDVNRDSNLVGYVDPSGEFVISPRFISAYPFDKHGATVKLPGQRTKRRIDFDGKVISGEFNDIRVFHPNGNYCGASVGWMQGKADVVIDGNGRIVSPRRFNVVRQEHEELIPVEYEAGIVGWINTASEDIFRINASGIGDYFESGLIPLSVNGDKWGLMNSRGDWVIEPEFDILITVGHNRFMLGNIIEGIPVVRLVDGCGNVMGEHELANIFDFSDGFAMVDRVKAGAADPDETETNFVDVAGKLVMPFWS